MESESSGAPERGPGTTGGGTLLALWAVVLLELISPVPALLTLGAIYVLLVRPPWFLALVKDLYGESGEAG